MKTKDYKYLADKPEQTNQADIWSAFIAGALFGWTIVFAFYQATI